MEPRLVIVDDHPVFRAFAARLLGADGFTVVGEAADGAEALRVARFARPDVVVLDVQLPDLDGFQVAAALDAEPDAPAVVLVSTRSAADYGSRIGRSTACGFIGKDELSGDAVRALLDACGDAAGLRRPTGGS